MKSKSKLYSRLLYFGFLLLVAELTIRAFYSISYKTDYFQPSQMVYRYYPEVKPILEKGSSTSGDSLTVLILGGSVVNQNFCDFDSMLNKIILPETPDKNFKVFRLAQYAQNTMDSRNKYDLLRDHPFDYVVFYHGINDTRTNNAPPELFDENYRHISSYNEYYILDRHPEINISVLPYFFDYFGQKILEMTGIQPKIPKEYNIIEYFRDKKILDKTWWEYGGNYKSSKTFANNLNFVLDLAQEKKEKVILFTYSYYMPADYHIDRFIEGELDYDFVPLKSWPVEIYGDPAFIPDGIRAHNEIIRETARSREETIFVDLEAALPKNGKYFYDICHLNQSGCEFMGREVLDILSRK